MITKQAANVRYLCASLTLLALSHAAVGQAPPPADLSSEEVVARVAPSVAVVLTGAGAGRLSGVGSAVIVRSDGILLTAYHVIKDAREVQVRLKTGEIYDRVELVAVGRAPRRGRHSYSRGQPAYSGNRAARRGPAGRAGLCRFQSFRAHLECVRRSFECRAASGGGGGNPARLSRAAIHRAVSPGSSGGAVVDSKGRALGIVVFSKPGRPQFRRSIDAVFGLASGSEHTALPSGGDLQPQQPERPPSSASLAHENPATHSARRAPFSSALAPFGLPPPASKRS